MTTHRPTIVHVTHEATEHVGGIGTVLEGLITSPVYQAAVGRSILVCPLWNTGPVSDALARLGPFATQMRYSGLDDHDPEGLAARLKPIEWAFNTPMVFGTRSFEHLNDETLTGEADVLLIDVSHADAHRTHSFKQLLADQYGLDWQRFEHEWDFEQWLRLAPAAIAALHAILPTEEPPAVVISHEYMGMCTALLAALDPHRRFRTVFHAHECATARSIVEHHPGHDCTFYPAMRAGLSKNLRVDDVFGDQSGNYRHMLISRAHRLDVTLAVGDETANEMRFLSDDMAKSRVELCYNGVPAARVDMDAKNRSRDLVFSWLEQTCGKRPDYLFTHVTRPVVSKGVWRDLKLCAHLAPRLHERGQTAIFLLLTCGAPIRSFEQVSQMASEYGWPMEHREYPPDVTGPERPIWGDMRSFNESAGANGAIRAVLVNQFGFTHDRLGENAPKDISIADLRRAADVEFGQSIYEPFGIAQFEPIHAGAICIPSSVCGSCGSARRAVRELGWTEEQAANLLIADYTAPDTTDPLQMTSSQRNTVEEQVVETLTGQLLDRLPKNDNDRLRLLESGQMIASRMSWDVICEDEFIPAIQSIL